MDHRGAPVLTQAEAEMAKDILIASQKRGYVWGDYGWWKRNAWDCSDETSPMWRHRKVKFKSMLTRNGTVVENRNWRKRIQSIERKNCLMRHYVSKRRRLMCVTPDCLAELEQFWYPGLIAKMRRKVYELPDIVVGPEPGLNPGSKEPTQGSSPVQHQDTVHPGSQGSNQGDDDPGHKKLQSTDTHTDSKRAQIDYEAGLRSCLDAMIAGRADSFRDVEQAPDPYVLRAPPPHSLAAGGAV